LSFGQNRQVSDRDPVCRLSRGRGGGALTVREVQSRVPYAPQTRIPPHNATHPLHRPPGPRLFDSDLQSSIELLPQQDIDSPLLSRPSGPPSSSSPKSSSCAPRKHRLSRPTHPYAIPTAPPKPSPTQPTQALYMSARARRRRRPNVARSRDGGLGRRHSCVRWA